MAGVTCFGVRRRAESARAAGVSVGCRAAFGGLGGGRGCFGVAFAKVAAAVEGLGGEGVAGYFACALIYGLFGLGVCCNLDWSARLSWTCIYAEGKVSPA